MLNQDHFFCGDIRNKIMRVSNFGPNQSIMTIGPGNVKDPDAFQGLHEASRGIFGHLNYQIRLLSETLDDFFSQNSFC